jgi:hypothetical protein
MNTMQRPSARTSRKIFSRLPSLEPTQRSRKFFSFTTGTPASPARHSTRKVLPRADRTAQQVAHRQRFQVAARHSAMSWRNHCLSASCPA